MVHEGEGGLGEEVDVLGAGAERSQVHVNAGAAVPDDALAERDAEVVAEGVTEDAVLDTGPVVVEHGLAGDAPTLSEYLSLPGVVIVLVHRVVVGAIAVAEPAGLVARAGSVHAAPVAAGDQPHVVRG